MKNFFHPAFQKATLKSRPLMMSPRPHTQSWLLKIFMLAAEGRPTTKEAVVTMITPLVLSTPKSASVLIPSSSMEMSDEKAAKKRATKKMVEKTCPPPILVMSPGREMKARP